MLRARGSRREEPAGAHVPDEIESAEVGSDPEHEAVLAGSLGAPLLVVLDTLNLPNDSRSCCMIWSPCGSTRSVRS
jgi:hypothetical protein